jgi:hypothetical protein
MVVHQGQDVGHFDFSAAAQKLSNSVGMGRTTGISLIPGFIVEMYGEEIAECVKWRAFQEFFHCRKFIQSLLLRGLFLAAETGLGMRKVWES